MTWTWKRSTCAITPCRSLMRRLRTCGCPARTPRQSAGSRPSPVSTGIFSSSPNTITRSPLPSRTLSTKLMSSGSASRSRPSAMAALARRGPSSILRLIGIELQMVPTRSAVHIGGGDFLTVAPMGGNKPIEDIEANLLPSAKAALDDLAWWAKGDQGGEDRLKTSRRRGQSLPLEAPNAAPPDKSAQQHPAPPLISSRAPGLLRRRGRQ